MSNYWHPFKSVSDFVISKLDQAETHANAVKMSFSIFTMNVKSIEDTQGNMDVQSQYYEFSFGSLY